MERMKRILLVLLVLSECLVLSTCLQPQYYIINKNLSWFEAQTYCRNHYTDLATVENEKEQTALLENLESSDFKYNFWIGLQTKIEWSWSDGYTGNGNIYTKWKSGYPDFGFNQYCVFFVKSGGWDDIHCNSNYPFICSEEIHFGPGFVFVNESMDWSSAQTYCRKNHKDLATVKNDDENKKLQDLVPRETDTWIGLFRDPNLYWSDGSNFTYNKIDYPNPINSMKVMCGFTSLKLSGKWKFSSCGDKYPSICYGRHLDVQSASVKQQVVKLRLKMKDSVDLNNPAVKEDLLKKLQDRLKKNGVTGVSLKWREQPDGRVFHKEKKREKTEL